MSIKYEEYLKAKERNELFYNENKTNFWTPDDLIKLKKEYFIVNLKCGRCKSYRKTTDFYNENGRQMKTCDRCRVLCRRNQQKYEEKKKANKLENNKNRK